MSYLPNYLTKATPQIRKKPVRYFKVLFGTQTTATTRDVIFSRKHKKGPLLSWTILQSLRFAGSAIYITI